MSRNPSTPLCVLALGLCQASITVPASGQTAPEDRQALSLSECLRIAMEKNHTRPASQFAVAIAEAQHRQALAAYWPQVNARGRRRRDELLAEFPVSRQYHVYPGAVDHRAWRNSDSHHSGQCVRPGISSRGHPDACFLSGADDQYQFPGVSHSRPKTSS